MTNSSNATIVADIGNSRLKWGRVDEQGRIVEQASLSLDTTEDWQTTFARWEGEKASRWVISSVNPPLAKRLEEFLKARGVDSIRWYLNASEVPVKTTIPPTETGGSDRALVALAASRRVPKGQAALVVMCGTAITIERVTNEGVWQGGAIAPGLGLSARALHQFTAQLPLIALKEAPPAWGNATVPCLAAGLFWGTVGAVRELLARQEDDLPNAAHFWTGGDALLLAPWVDGDRARIVPDLVMHGLIEAERTNAR